jgi:hypothetical protein
MAPSVPNVTACEEDFDWGRRNEGSIRRRPRMMRTNELVVDSKLDIRRVFCRNGLEEARIPSDVAEKLSAARFVCQT